jgi:sigma-E factor negative regulatory protein RseA
VDNQHYKDQLHKEQDETEPGASSSGGASDRQLEVLSSLMDGEADELEIRRILRDLGPEQLAAWRRFHTVSASLQHDLRQPRLDLSAGVRQRLDQVEGLPARGLLHHRVLRVVGQGAIAASVALAVLGGTSLLQTAGTSTGADMLADADTPALNGEFNASELARTASFDAEVYNRLERAVYRELTEQAPEIPVSFEPDFPVVTPSAE